jgi:mannose-1-phosphate guanylyltransferase/mannose-6-phosphate isomerase
MKAIVPVILSGGVGSRLWPLSRALQPKQLLPLLGDTTMLQATLARVTDPARYQPPLIVCSEEHRFIVAEQLRQSGIEPQGILLEPEGRNTAPAVAVAALKLTETAEDSLILVLPSDHVIKDDRGFRDAVQTAAKAAMAGSLMTFGITPGRPETGYGYIRGGEALPSAAACRRVEEFVEKPDRATAESFVTEGTYSWNSGMFLFSAARYLEELGRLEPDMLESCRQAISQGAGEGDFFRLDAAHFAQAPAKSIDYAVMEHTTDAGVMAVDIGWSDVGSWTALWELQARDDDGNVVLGDTVLHEVRNSYLRSEGPLIAAVGAEDMVVVANDDVVLVAAKDRAQQVKAVVEKLSAAGRDEPLSHREVRRPWGSYRQIDKGEGFQVKRITVKPGEKLSLQMHHQRAEHWVVVTGTARVTLDEKEFLLGENESTFIPIGTKHRLENPGKEALELIEVQCGGYLGEDDIVRFEDIYGRHQG